MKPNLSLASFADTVSCGNGMLRPAVTKTDLIRNPLPPRKAGYIYPQRQKNSHRMIGLIIRT
jgi:hypothetical protein